MIYDVSLNDYGKVCKSSCAIYIQLIKTFITFTDIDSVHIHFYWYPKKNCFNKLHC